MDLIDKFLSFLSANEKSVNTLKNYKHDLRNFEKWFCKTNNEILMLNKITPTDLKIYKKILIAANKKPKTINRHLASLKAFINWGVQIKDLNHNIKIPKNIKESKIDFRWLDKLQQNELLRNIENTKNTRNIAIIKILLNTGLRVNELCELTWDSVVMSDRKGKLTVKSGKGGKIREIPLNKDCRNAFKNLGHIHNTGIDTRIFKGQRGNLSPRGVQLMLKKVVQNSNLKNITPHQLRHTFCKNLINMDVGLEKVAFLAGHESLDIGPVLRIKGFAATSKKSS